MSVISHDLMLTGTSLLSIAALAFATRERLARKRCEGRLRAALEPGPQGADWQLHRFASFAHEAKNLLSVIVTVADCLALKRLDAGSEKDVRILRASSELLASLAADVLDLASLRSRTLSLSRAELCPRALARESLEIIEARARAKRLEVRCEIDATVPATIRSDSLRLRQILLNLLANAVKYTREGEVVVRVSVERPGAEPSMLRFEVRDTGIGIPEDRREQVFRRFARLSSDTDAEESRQAGTGLGLAISKELVEQLHGRIGFESSPGRGSTFYFSVPLA